MNLAELLTTVRRVEVRTNRLVNDTMVGAYLSRFKGRGMDFDEVREYQPGDEVRRIDWNVTARTGVAHIKKYIEEREMTVMVLVDASASGATGSVHQSKRELAAELTGEPLAPSFGDQEPNERTNGTESDKAKSGSRFRIRR